MVNLTLSHRQSKYSSSQLIHCTPRSERNGAWPHCLVTLISVLIMKDCREQLSDDEKTSVRGVILQLLRHLLTQAR